MPITNNTPNRAYPLPHAGNKLSFDLPRILSAFGMIDADVADLYDALADKAGFDSPAFTGTPTAPTASTGTESAQIATTAFVAAEIDLAVTNLLAGAPGALDTLNELAAALGNDANFSATVANQLAAHAAALALRLRIDAAQSFSDGEKALGRLNLGAIGNIVSAPILLTSSGTYTPSSARVKGIIVRVQGGGGSGGGAAATGANEVSGGGGGGSGGLAVRFIPIADASMYSATVTIGAGGAASTSTGNAGGNSSFADGTHTLTGNGGSGGSIRNASTTASAAEGGARGTASGGTRNRPGNPGQPVLTMAGYGLRGYSGAGAPSDYGGGGGAVINTGVASAVSGQAAPSTSYGAGGGGAYNTASVSASSSGAGANGVVEIQELF